MSKLKLSNGATYTIADYAIPNSFVILLNSVTSAEVLETLTEENLSEIQFMTDSGRVTGVYHDKLLCGYADNGDMLAISINDADLCRYGLVLDENNRILSATVQRYAQEDAIIVDKLPEGNLPDYLYVDGEVIYDPLPEPEQPDPQPTQEERIAQLELDNSQLKEQLIVAKILLGVE